MRRSQGTFHRGTGDAEGQGTYLCPSLLSTVLSSRHINQGDGSFGSLPEPVYCLYISEMGQTRKGFIIQSGIVMKTIENTENTENRFVHESGELFYRVWKRDSFFLQ